IWATGSFANTVDFDPGPAVHNVTSNGFQDIIKLNWDADGNYIDAQKIGGTNSDYGAWIDIDAEGAILISGIFEGLVDFDPGDVTFNLNSAFTGWDGYVAKYCTVYTINNYVSICEGDSYFAGGANQTEPGDYFDYYTPIEGCDSIIITHLSINNPVVNLGANYTICSGTTTTLNAGNPGATYLWNTGATTQTITIGTAGTYSVTITDPAGCVASDAITISVNPSPTVNLGADISACADETVVLNAGNPGANYLWNTGANTQTINANTTGTYSVTVTNGFGCFASDVINVNIHALPTVELGASIDFCTGENVTLDAGNPGATYLWSTGATTQTITTSTPGTYSVTVTNAFGCDKSDNITLTEHAAPIVDLGADIIVCADELIILDAENPGANYAWNTGAFTQTITVTESGNYGVVVTNAFGCSDNDLVNIVIHDLPVLDLGTTLQFCENTDITLDAENIGSTYLWNTGATTQTITTAIPGTFSVTVTNANGCIAFDEVDVTVLPAPVIDLGIDTGFCAGSTFTINATTPDVSYLWNTGATTSTINVNTPGLFSVIITNGFGCSDTDAINLIEYDLPVVNLGDDDSYCSGEAILLDATNPDCTYLWNTGATTPTLYITESGTFSVTVTNAQGCSAFDEINIIVNPLPVADLGPDVTTCAEVPVLLDATTPFCSYLWSTGETTATISVSEPGLYTVAITNSFGCFIIDSIHIFNYAPTAVALILPFETICNNIAPFTLTGGTPDGGIYSGDGVTDNIFNANEAGAGTHIITYSYTDINGCTTTAEQSITVTICQEVETGAEGRITLYPNPAMNQFIIENTTHQHLENIAIYNANGDLVFSEINIAVGSPVQSVDIQHLPSGYYQVKLNGTIVLPLIISK
ncbi:MAG: T9SS type A sorting domain-containing protein, partial [Chitinophagales bacterium]